MRWSAGCCWTSWIWLEVRSKTTRSFESRDRSNKFQLKRTWVRQTFPSDPDAASSVSCSHSQDDLGVDLDTHRKPKNARSKRALEAREPKEVEDPRTAVFVKGTHTGELINNVMKELVSQVSKK